MGLAAEIYGLSGDGAREIHGLSYLSLSTIFFIYFSPQAPLDGTVTTSCSGKGRGAAWEATVVSLASPSSPMRSREAGLLLPYGVSELLLTDPPRVVATEPGR